MTSSPGAYDPKQWEQHSREFLLVCDGQGRIVWFDDRARRLFGDLAGREFPSLAPPGTEEKARALIDRGRREPMSGWEVVLVGRGLPETYAFCAQPAADGCIDLFGVRFPDGHDTTLRQLSDSMSEVIELNRQVTRQKRELEAQKKELERTCRELSESNQGVLTLHAELEEKAASLRRHADVKSRVVANVSHEFRTPLHTILGLSKLLLDTPDRPLDDEQVKQVRFIRSAAEELSEMVNDLLDLSKVESGRVHMRPVKFSVSELFSALRGMLRPLMVPGAPNAPAADVDLIFDMPDGEIALETDHGKVAQVLRNLVSNGLKFTEKGEVRVGAAARGDWVDFFVQDTGIGIATDDFFKIFEEFGQIDGPLQHRVKGTGLGLPLARKLAELLGGTLDVKSEPGKGSTFTLSVPALHPEVRELASISERPLDPSKAPVLVVEDDRKTIFIYERYLSMAGFQIVPARTLDEARTLVATSRPAAIVLDVMLEGEVTWDFLSELKRNPATHDIPVLVVTVTNRSHKARALGADEFWLKPIDQDRLIRKLKSLAKPGMPTKVLMIDDDERSRYLMERLLDQSPYALSLASTGPEGVRLAQELRPSVIFLDFLLKDITAFDVLDDLKADPRTRGIPVIVVTAHMLDASDRKRLAAETEAIVSKESLSRELAINRIRDALAKAGVSDTSPSVHSS